MEKIKAITSNFRRHACIAIAIGSIILALKTNNTIDSSLLVGLAIFSSIYLLRTESKSIDIDELFK